MAKRFIFSLSLLMIALVATIAYHYYKPAPPLNDTIEYQYAADNLLKNNILYGGNPNQPVDFRLYSKRTLGYPVFLLFQQQNEHLVLMSSVLLYVLLFFLGLHILSLFIRKKAAFLSYILLFLLHIAFTVHTTFQMADLLVAAAVTSIVLVYYSPNTTTYQKVFYISLLWGLGLFLKPVFLPSLLLIPVILIYLKRVTAKWHYWLLVPLAVWTTGCAVNYSSSGVFEYSSISTINLGQYNAKLTVANMDGVDAASNFAHSEAFSIPRTLPQYVHYKQGVRKEAITAVQDNPLAYAKVHLAGMIKMVLDPGRFEIYTFFGMNDHKVSLTELLYSGDWDRVEEVMCKNKVVLFAFLALLFVGILRVVLVSFSLKRVKEIFFMLCITTYFVVITGPVGAARFMLPVGVLYLVLAAIGTQRILAFFQKRSKR
ncbi:hypothetical protein N9772_07030 [Bacteroidia bacterium]|nr:hypothetical protein [Bacteroidia bacterium]